jgi:formiminotetrahydrofolate cyclodeaminase
MLDIRQAPSTRLLDRSLGEIIDAIADGDTALRDENLAALAVITSAGCLVAACTDLADLPECQPWLLDLARVLARTRYLRQRLTLEVEEEASAERALLRARSLPSSNTHEGVSRRAAVQLALRRALDRRLSVAAIAAEVARLAREVHPLAGASYGTLTRLAETLAGTALTAALDGVQRELDAADEPWTGAYIGSELERLRRESTALTVVTEPATSRADAWASAVTVRHAGTTTPARTF